MLTVLPALAMWMILARMSGENPANMDEDKAWTVESGISDGSFTAIATSRQQFVTMLWRWAKAQGMDVSVGEDTNILSYEEAFGISEYAIPAFQWACGAGVVSGYTDHPEGRKRLYPRSDGKDGNEFPERLIASHVSQVFDFFGQRKGPCSHWRMGTFFPDYMI